MSVAIVDRLRAVLPADAVVTDPLVLAERSADASRLDSGSRPVAVVRARSTGDVSLTLAAASESRTPVVPQGALSGLVGAASAIDGAILLDLTAMDRILRIDHKDRIAVVQPGVVVADLQRAVAAEGLFYAPDPASAEWATVGGTIATNAGGMRCIKYGVTRDAVRSLEVVLADGSVVRTRVATVKGVAGLDITSLVVGSEGTLAVVTEATLALRPAPGPELGVAGAFASIESALAAADELADDARLPSTLELLDAVALRGIRRVIRDLPVPADTAAWLLAVTDERVGAEDDVDRFARAFERHGALSVERAADPVRLHELFAARRALSPGLAAVSGGATHGDLAVPRSVLAAFASGAERIARDLGVEVSLAGHVGDGNLHPTVVFDPADAVAAEAAQRAARALLDLAQSLGGTVAGEHGIGTVKQYALEAELAPEVRGLQRRIKEAFDPDGILNPGRKL